MQPRLLTLASQSAWLFMSAADRKSTRLNSSHLVISYAVFCLKKKKSIAPHSAHRYAGVDGGPHVRVEEVRLEKDLTVDNRDDVRGHVGVDLHGLRLDELQRRP